MAVWCGGNEFAPYARDNMATIGVLERTISHFDPTRLFLRTSPDDGSIHTYPDMDPTWYPIRYRWAPYVAETGMHSVAEARSLYEIVNPAEFKNLGRLWDKSFKQSHPEFLHHFVEYNPSRVPRMLSRASHVDDMTNPSLESLAEGSQIGAGEFYQILSETMQANYPVTTGLMPWVFKRPWPVVSGIMLLDGFGQPTASYYFLRRTYEPTHVMAAIPHLLWAPGETIPITAKILHDMPRELSGLSLRVAVLDDKFQQKWQGTKASVSIPAGPSVTVEDLGEFTIANDWKDRYFFVVAELRDASDQLVSRSVYWPRSLSMLGNPAERNKWRQGPRIWPYFKKGPWLKPVVAQTKTDLQTQVVSCRNDGGEIQARIRIKNTGKVPAFAVMIDVDGIRRLFRCEDNYFWLATGEQRELEVVIQPREKIMDKKLNLTVEAFNAPRQSLTHTW